MKTNQNISLFTEISNAEEENLSGGNLGFFSFAQQLIKPTQTQPPANQAPRSQPTFNFNFFRISGVGGDATSGGVSGNGNSIGNTGGNGVVIVL